MRTWNEAEHPRDDEGKFTYKNGGENTGSGDDDYVLYGGVDKTDFKREELLNSMFKNTIAKENSEKYRNKLLNILGDKATREDIFYSTVHELIQKIKENDLDNILKQKVAELLLDPAYSSVGYNAAKYIVGADTLGMVDLAHEKPINPEYALNTIELKSYENVTDISDREYLRKKLTEQYRDYGYAINTIKGRIFESNSAPSQRLAQDSDFLSTIKENKRQILNGEDVSGDFPRYNDYKQSNWHFAIGHYDLRNGYLDKEGNLHIQMYDTYDFNKKNHTLLNQAGRNLMIKGKLKPSFSIHDIVIPNHIINEIWE